MTASDTDQRAAVEAAARNAAALHDPAHDALHLERVVRNVQAILQHQPELQAVVNEDALYAAAWLHDCVQLTKGDGPAGEAARQSAQTARQIMLQAGYPNSTIERACSAIVEHSFSAKLDPSSTEAAILQDADRLDALGAIGIARLWAVAGAMGSLLYDPEDPLAGNRELDDPRFALDHVASKLLRLPSMMHTRAARTIARKRAQYIEQYRAQLLAEIDGQDA